MYAVFMLLWALLITPLSMRLFVVWHGLSSLPGGHFLLSVSGLRALVFWQLQIQNKQLLLRCEWHGHMHTFVLHRRKCKRASRIKLPKQRVQRIRKRALHLLASILDIRLTIDLGLADAAQTALACGALTAMLGQVPCLHYLRMLPQYAQGEQLHVRGNCILFYRLGKLLLIAVLFILYARQKAGGARDAGNHSSHQRRYADGA